MLPLLHSPSHSVLDGAAAHNGELLPHRVCMWRILGFVRFMCAKRWFEERDSAQRTSTLVSSASHTAPLPYNNIQTARASSRFIGGTFHKMAIDGGAPLWRLPLPAPKEDV